MNIPVSRIELPQAIFPVLPFLLFFPLGLRSAGALLFLIAVLVSGGYREKWRNVRQSPMFWPVAVMLGVSVLGGIFLDSSAPRFWASFAHYQIYLFLLLFLCMGAGRWQQRAACSFAAGALCAATLFYLKALGLLPDADLFQNYLTYTGNNAILLAVMLALAGGVFLYEAVAAPGNGARWSALAGYLYVAPTVLLFGQSRTAALLCVLLSVLALAPAAVRSPRKALVLLALPALVFTAGWEFSPGLRDRVERTLDAVNAVAEGTDVRSGSADARLELYGITAGIIADKPLTGHGIGQWVVLYAQRAKGLQTGEMITPHNEYLLYASELGVAGVTALLFIWLTQFFVALRLGGRRGMYLGMLTVTLVVGGMFNAILRDAAFGLPLMILLAIPLAGVRWPLQRRAAPFNDLQITRVTA